MADYQCTKCNYRFSKERKPLACPYCGKTGTVDFVPDANDILADVGEQEKRMQDIEERKKEWDNRRK